jgi:hypothetical protein
MAFRHRLLGPALLVAALPACKTLFPPDQKPGAAPTPPPNLTVKKAPEEVVVAAWSGPKRLPPGGGQAQILVRARKRGGAPFPGVEVRLHTDSGTLFSNGRVLTTDDAGTTRDRLSARRSAVVTLNAGGTVYRFRVPTADDQSTATP